MNFLKFDFIYDGNFRRTKRDAAWTWLLNLYQGIFCFNDQSYLYNLLRTIELLKKNSELSIINEFPRNDTLASHTRLTDHDFIISFVKYFLGYFLNIF